MLVKLVVCEISTQFFFLLERIFNGKIYEIEHWKKYLPRHCLVARIRGSNFRLELDY